LCTNVPFDGCSSTTRTELSAGGVFRGCGVGVGVGKGVGTRVAAGVGCGVASDAIRCGTIADGVGEAVARAVA
jgi:hypothetical protein